MSETSEKNFEIEIISENIENPWRRKLTDVIPKKPTKIKDIIINPRACIMTEHITQEYLDRIYNFNIREDDVWIVTFPKCGTTWIQEMCWLILNNYDFQSAKRISLELRSPFFELNVMAPNFDINTIEVIENLNNPRLIKTHLPLALLPRQLWNVNSKIIYVTRNPRDAALSNYHHLFGMRGDEVGSKENFLNYFASDKIVWGPYWDHVLEFWKLRHVKNVLFLTYEEMKQNLESVIQKVCKFLDKPIIMKKKMEEMLQHLSFDSMKNNKACNHELEKKMASTNFQFFRKGKVGEYKNEFSTEMKEIFDKWVEKNISKSDFNIYQ